MRARTNLGILVRLEQDQLHKLNDLSKETRVPRVAYIREAVDDLLVKYRKLKPPKRRP